MNKYIPVFHLRGRMFRKSRSVRPQLLGRAERTEEYVSMVKRRERRWRMFSAFC